MSTVATMRATYTRTGMTFQPVIASGRKKEILWGPPLGMRQTAIKYAAIEIHRRLARRGGK